MNSVLTVRQLNLYVRSLIESDQKLFNVSVAGEISNFKSHYSSGHLYFTLKDNDAAIRCVMFKGNAQKIKFDVCDGLKVTLRGRVSLYEKDGQYQFYAEEMLPSGIGDIALKFEQIKAKLEGEGLFDASSKRALPKFPKRIAVITSKTGAAVQDIINILSRRWPVAEIVMCPVSVQGELAVGEMLNSLDRVYALDGIDVIIIGRGGGSIEDLWAFNDERLARKIYESPIPVISAVGHETDFTICDFVADLRAPTPSAAAELAVPSVDDFQRIISRYQNNLKNSLNSKYSLCKAKLEKYESNVYFSKPVDSIVNHRYQSVDSLVERLKNAALSNFEADEKTFEKLVSKLETLSPLKTLTRGYTAVSKNGVNVTSVNEISKKDLLNLKFADGSASCEIIEVNVK
ncbi:MAG: exodeoxyribonuclease VII large subunit [Ruminococcaceae bacterium]|nr:exodeoxyribonuclease VII large subunit [Oscillospiraceae bacterium]